MSTIRPGGERAADGAEYQKQTKKASWLKRQLGRMAAWNSDVPEFSPAALAPRKEFLAPANLTSDLPAYAVESYISGRGIDSESMFYLVEHDSGMAVICTRGTNDFDGSYIKRIDAYHSIDTPDGPQLECVMFAPQSEAHKDVFFAYERRLVDIPSSHDGRLRNPLLSDARPYTDVMQVNRLDAVSRRMLEHDREEGAPQPAFSDDKYRLVHAIMSQL